MYGYPLAYRLSVAALVFLCSACAGRSSKTLPPPPSERAPFAPEVRLTAGGQAHVGKVVEVAEDGITFLPNPYWRAESRTLLLRDITRVEVRREGGGARGFLWGFATAFTVSGAVLGASAEYNADYADALLGSTLLGAGVGLVAALVGSSDNRTRYDLEDRTAEERRELLLRFRAREAEGRAKEGTW